VIDILVLQKHLFLMTGEVQ